MMMMMMMMMMMILFIDVSGSSELARWAIGII
jgi:hypothetical protein